MPFASGSAPAVGRVRRLIDSYYRAGGPEDELASAIDDATDSDRIADEYLAAGTRLASHVVDGQALVDEALEREEAILLEGQLGTMRDLDWGVYPYVTSSSPIPGGASLGAGLPAVRIDKVIGVAKAYTTAVGAGPLPTELEDGDGILLRERGVEYGTSTGRARRCGWYDAVAVRFSVRLAGYSSIALTKLDVLDAFERISLCVAYRDPETEPALGDRACLGIGLWTARADLRGARRVADRYGVGPLMDGTARSGAGLRRAHRGARRASRSTTCPWDRPATR